MPDEYIKRKDVLEFSRIFADQVWETGGYRNCTTIAVPVEKIEEIPSADVAPVKHGRWKNQIQCSECGWYFEDDVLIEPILVFFNYCPNCGARMEEWMVKHE